MNAAVKAGRAPHTDRWTTAFGLVLLGAAVVFCQAASAQEPASEPLTPEELEALVGPIALYPDDVLAVVLPAATYPLQIVQAARFLEDRAEDPSLEPSPDWDDSIVALLNYPEVVRLLNDDLDWTWALGEAVLDDQATVIAAVQTFRARAYLSGNLRTDDRQIVTESDNVIEIAPADPEVVYIPYYEPERVVVYQSAPVYHYYPRPYPIYYYPYPFGYSFPTPYFWGVTSAFTIGWHSHFLHVHHHTHVGHPYYRHHYYAYTPYYWRSGVNININVNRVSHVWQPSHRRGPRPYYRDDTPRVRTVYEGHGAPRTSADARSSVRSAEGRTTRRSQTADTSGRVIENRPTTGTARPGQRTIGGIAPSATQSRAATPRTGTGTGTRTVEGGATRAQGDSASRFAAPNRNAALPRAGQQRSGTQQLGVPAQRSAPQTSLAPQQRNAPVERNVAPQRQLAPSRNVPMQRSLAPQRSAPVERSAPIQRSAPIERSAPAQRSAPAARSAPAPRSGGASRGDGGRQGSRVEHSRR